MTHSLICFWNNWGCVSVLDHLTICMERSNLTGCWYRLLSTVGNIHTFYWQISSSSHSWLNPDWFHSIKKLSVWSRPTDRLLLCNDFSKDRVELYNMQHPCVSLAYLSLISVQFHFLCCCFSFFELRTLKCNIRNILHTLFCVHFRRIPVICTICVLYPGLQYTWVLVLVIVCKSVFDMVIYCRCVLYTVLYAWNYMWSRFLINFVF